MTSKVSPWNKVSSPTTVFVCWWRAALPATGSDAAVNADASLSRAALWTRIWACLPWPLSRRASQRSTVSPTALCRECAAPREPTRSASCSTCPRKTMCASMLSASPSRPRRAKKKSSRRQRFSVWSHRCDCNASDAHSAWRRSASKRTSCRAPNTLSCWRNSSRRSANANAASPNVDRQWENHNQSPNK